MSRSASSHFALAVALLTLGCRAAEAPDLAASRQAREAQLHHLLEDPDSPLAVAGGHYLAVGESLELSRTCEAVPTGGAVRFAWRDGRFACERGCGPEPKALTASERVELDGCHLFASLQSGRGRVLVHRPELLKSRDASDLPHHPVAAGWILRARFERAAETGEVPFATTRGASKSLPLAGHLAFEREGREHRLAAFGRPDDEGRLSAFVPFTDSTTGVSSYPVGRYLNVEVPPGPNPPVVLDFNQAYNPYCAYSEHYNCPVPPVENALPFAVEAGEKHAKSGAFH